MNKLSKILSVMYEAFKTLTLSNIEISEVNGPSFTVRVVAQDFVTMDIPDRVDILTDILRNKSTKISLNYIITFEPLTPMEYSELINNKIKPIIEN